MDMGDLAPYGDYGPYAEGLCRLYIAGGGTCGILLFNGEKIVNS